MKTVYVRPIVTEKSLATAANGVYSFFVPTWATKQAVAQAVSRYFHVSVTSVRVMNVKGRLVQFKRRQGHQAKVKKAIVQLKSGDRIADFRVPVETGSETNQTNKEQGQTKKSETATKSKITVRSKSKKAEV